MKQPEALRLAKELVAVHQGHADEGPSTFSEAAAELRRLYEANQAMLEALNSYMKAGIGNSTDFEMQHEAYYKARAAIAKGELHENSN